MTTKEYLQQAIDIQDEIRIKTDEIERLRALTNKIIGVLVADRVQGGTQPDSMRYSDEIVMLKIDVEKLVIKLAALKRQIRTQIEGMSNPTYRKLLEMLYINGMNLVEAAGILRYGYEWTCRLHGKALLEFAEQNHIGAAI